MMNVSKDKDRKKKQKRKESDLEKIIFHTMAKSMQAALDQAITDLLKDWGK